MLRFSRVPIDLRNIKLNPLAGKVQQIDLKRGIKNNIDAECLLSFLRLTHLEMSFKKLSLKKIVALNLISNQQTYYIL